MNKITLEMTLNDSVSSLKLNCTVEDAAGAESFSLCVDNTEGRDVKNLADIKRAMAELEQLRITRTIVKLLKDLHNIKLIQELDKLKGGN